MDTSELWKSLGGYNDKQLIVVLVIVALVAASVLLKIYLTPGTARLAAQQDKEKREAEEKQSRDDKALGISEAEKERLIRREEEAHESARLAESRLRDCMEDKARSEWILNDPDAMRARVLRLEREAEPSAVASLGRVLVIDDNPDARKLLKRRLEALGYAVEATYSGEQGLEQVQIAEEPFALIILDNMMPVMDGMQTLEKLREIGVQTPVLFLTGYGENMDKERAKELGARDILIKPVESEALKKAVVGAIGG